MEMLKMNSNKKNETYIMQSAHIEELTNKAAVDNKDNNHDAPAECAVKAPEPNCAEAYFCRGNTYYKSRMIDKAIEDFSKAIELKPDYSAAYNSRGNAYRSKGYCNRAILDYGNAIRLMSDLLNAFNNTKTDDIKSEDNNAKAEDNKNYNNISNTEEDCSSLARLKLDYAAAYNNRGNAFMSKNMYDKAIEDFCKAIEANPNHASSYYNRGNAYMSKIEYDKAIEDFSKAIELKPDYAKAYYNRGNIYYSKGMNNDALADYNNTIKLSPDYTLAYNNRGVIYSSNGKNSKAIADFSKAIKLDPNYVFAYINRGSVYYSKGMNNKAIEDFSKAIELNPGYALAYNNRGAAYYKSGNVDNAIIDYTKAIELNSDYALAYSNRGNSYMNKGRYDYAVSDFNNAIKLKPAYMSADCNNFICSDIHQLAKSTFDYEKVLKIDIGINKKVRSQKDFINYEALIFEANRKISDKELYDKYLTAVSIRIFNKFAVSHEHVHGTSISLCNVPEWAKKVAANAANGQDWIESVKISKNVELIEKGAFRNCKNLKEIDFSEAYSLNIIEKNAFAGCEKLSSVSIPNDCLVKNNAFPKGCKIKRLKLNLIAQFLPITHSPRQEVSFNSFKNSFIDQASIIQRENSTINIPAIRINNSSALFLDGAENISFDSLSNSSPFVDLSCSKNDNGDNAVADLSPISLFDNYR